MNIERITDRNITVIFEEPFRTATHLILGDNRVYVCDTFLGPDSMTVVSKIIEQEGMNKKPVVIFNSHADWDHIWGNCHFKKAVTVGHLYTRERILSEGEAELRRWSDYMQGTVTLRSPNLLFTTKVRFADDNVEFFHTPGHTHDSSSCIDHEEKVLFVGDNVESDIPYVNNPEFEVYISTLKDYLRRDWIALVSGHDPVQYDNNLVKSNIRYLQQFKDWAVNLDDIDEGALSVHITSLTSLVEFLLKGTVDERVREHYRNAIAALKDKGMTNSSHQHLEQLSRIVDAPLS